MILVNDDTPGLSWGNPQSGRYATQQTIESPVGPLSFDRGWKLRIDARLKGQPFRFVDTHLETEESPLVQQTQAAEFLAGPGKGGTIVVTGDFVPAADCSTTTSYAQLTAPGKFPATKLVLSRLLGPGISCCAGNRKPPGHAGARGAEQPGLDVADPDRPDPQPWRRPLRRRRCRTDRGLAVPGNPAILAL